MRACALLLPLLGCGHRLAGAPSPVTWDILTLTAVGDSHTEEELVLQTKAIGPDAIEVQTLRTRGLWTDPDGVTGWFDSEAPTQDAPWPQVLGHAVASVPTRVQLDSARRPVALVDAEQWSSAARRALEDTDLPEEGRAAGLGLIDPAGFVLELRRYLPGAPTDQWSRTERIVGFMVERSERCERPARNHWVCAGEIGDTGDARGALVGLSTWTNVHLDRAGITHLETGWSATLVDASGDRPAAGRRLVVRR
ncbi:MAG: hypothetical protein ACI8PZ_005348 [Myxococcota bacterium]|jgi:hypothetical protein